MKRKEFISLGGKAVLGTFFIPSFLLAACRKETLFEDSSFNGKVIIVGAGAAGLYAGYVLKSQGIDFKILEASNRIGGRLGKLDGFVDFPLDLGAQWLHGRNSILGDLIRKTKTDISKDNSDLVYWFNQQLTSSLPQNIQRAFEEDEGLPDISFKDYARQKGFGPEYDYIVEGIAGDQGADASHISMAANAKEEENWSSGDNDFKFKATFFDLFDQHIIPHVREHIELNTIIEEVDYSGSVVQVSDQLGSKHIADKLILTVPIPILKDGDINFEPPLSAEKTSAFSKIGMGAGMKVFLKFKTEFYDENIIGGETCAAYANEKEGKEGNDHVLLAFIMGGQAQALSNLGSDQAIVNQLLNELDGMYNGQASANFEKAYVQDWTKNPFVKGAYSYSTIGIGNSRSIAAKSVNNKLFFAGEAFNLNGHHQTVHGAVESGYNAVSEILNEDKK